MKTANSAYTLQGTPKKKGKFSQATKASKKKTGFNWNFRARKQSVEVLKTRITDNTVKGVAFVQRLRGTRKVLETNKQNLRDVHFSLAEKALLLSRAHEADFSDNFLKRLNEDQKIFLDNYKHRSEEELILAIENFSNGAVHAAKKLRQLNAS